MFGFLNINKPQGLTSRQITNRVSTCLKNSTEGRVKIGHVGTLDPLATGVLVLAIGPATRLTTLLHADTKSYLGTFRLGLKSDSDDVDGNVTVVENAPEIKRDQLEKILDRFTGEIQQRPPAFSALKINGKRAYKLARKGVQFEVPSRTVWIDQLKLTGFDPPDFQVDVVCSAGTYIRSLGRDMAIAAGSTAVMTALCRTSVGIFNLQTCADIDELEKMDLRDWPLINPETCFPEMERVEVSPGKVELFADGGLIRMGDRRGTDTVMAIEQHADGPRMVCILTRIDEVFFKPAVNIAPYWRKMRNR